MEHEFDLEPGEVVLKEVRKYWLFFALQLVPFVLLAFLPLLIPSIIKSVPALAAFSHFGGWGTPVGRVALGCWWLLLWSSVFNICTQYFLNAWIITNQRIVEMEQHGFFHREVSSLLLGRVQDVTIQTEGILHSVLDIGDINVQSAGAQERFTMDNVANPPALRDLILQHAAAHTEAPGTGVN